MPRTTPLILVVDDTEANRFVVAGILARAGYAVIEAGTGHEAVVKFEEHPDLVVLDVRLPDTTGFELARSIRVRPDRESIPILFISASFTGPGAHAQGLDSGADGYLTHPVDPGVLLATVRSLLRVRRSEEVGRMLADASQQFAQSLDPDDIANALVRIAVARFADACVVCQFTDDGVAVVALTHTRPASQRALTDILTKYPPKLEGKDLMGVPFQQASPAPYEPPGARGAELTALGLRSAVTVALVARGHVFGSVTFLCESASVDDVSLRLFIDVAHRAALAVDNARLFRVADAARKEAQVANSAKMDFLAAMSHELRTPLNAIAGYVELIAMGIRGPVSDAQRGDLTRISQNQRHLSSLIEDILNYAKLEAGRIEYDIGPVNVTDAMSEVVSLMTAPFDTKGVRLAFDLPERGAMALADADRLRQVLLNLLGNAVKFTRSGGVVSLTGQINGSDIRIECRDTGRGIPRDKLEAIFEPFVQVTSKTSEPREGLGLGLSISRDLMRGMRGDLLVDSELGEGSVFTLVLPRAGLN